MADERVESSLASRGIGLGADAQSIETLRLRQAEVEKANRPKPSRSFGQVLGGKLSDAPPSAKEQALKKLPKSGPKPKLLHPKLGEVFGRDEDVVIKG